MTTIDNTLGLHSDGEMAAPVRMPLDILNGHMLCTGASGSGKSAFVASVLMRAAQDPTRSIVTLDPHGSIVNAVASLLPREREATTHLWNLGHERSIGLNGLTPCTGAPEVNADTMVTVLHSMWKQNWGPRTEQLLQTAILTLAQARLPAMPTGDSFHPFTMLNATRLWYDEAYRAQILTTITDPALRNFWLGEFQQLAMNSNHFLAAVMPPSNKIGALHYRTPARNTLDQPGFPALIQNVLERPGCLLVNLAPAEAGEETARLFGTLLLRYMQALLKRRAPHGLYPRVTIVIDEAQSFGIGAADQWMNELTKYGVNLIALTQSLKLAGEIDPRLPLEILPNTANMVAFRAEGEDAEVMAGALGKQVSAQDLRNLPPRICYAKVQFAGRPLPVFSMSTVDVPSPDLDQVKALTERTHAEHGWSPDQLVEFRQKRDEAVGRLGRGRTSTKRKK